MDPAVAQLIGNSIAVCVPALVTVATTLSVKRQAKQNAARHNILQLILEDKVAVKVEGKLPENYQAIMDELTDYHKSGGNHYVDGKVEDYKKWYEKIKQKGVPKNQ